MSAPIAKNYFRCIMWFSLVVAFFLTALSSFCVANVSCLFHALAYVVEILILVSSFVKEDNSVNARCTLIRAHYCFVGSRVICHSSQ